MTYVRAITRFKNGELIKAREDLGLSQVEMAEFLGVPYTVYNGYENLKLMPNESRCLKIASKLSIPPDVLWDKYAPAYRAAELRGSNVVVSEISRAQFEHVALSSPEVQKLMAPTEMRATSSDRREFKSTMLRLVNEIKDLNVTGAEDLSEQSLRRTAKVLKMYYGLDEYKHDYTILEIAKEVGVTRERIRQVVMKGLRILSRKINSVMHEEDKEILMQCLTSFGGLNIDWDSK